MNEDELQIAGGMAWDKWLNLIGRKPTTGWIWRKEGRIETCNIDGKLFVRAEAIAKFWERAQKGEFAKKPAVPKRSKS